MTTITELEALAIAAMSPAPYERAQGQAGLIAAGIMQNILALIALCKQQHESMLAVLCDPEGTPCFDGSNGDREVIAEALAAFENFGVEK